MHTFLSNLANRQTDKQTRANAFTSSFVGGENIKSCDQHWLRILTELLTGYVVQPTPVV